LVERVITRGADRREENSEKRVNDYGASSEISILSASPHSRSRE